MSIKVFKDKIVFQNGSTSYTLAVRTSGDAGLKLNGILEATEFANTVPHPGFQGTVSGYNTNGNLSTGSALVTTIDKFPFASDGNATDVADMSFGKRAPAGQSSTESGYACGGFNDSSIDKFPFSTDADATIIGGLTQARYRSAGQSSEYSGYTSGGSSNVIDKFSFASDGNATDVGDLSQARYGMAGHSSTEYGYCAGSTIASTPTPTTENQINIIEKFPFASDANVTDVGDLTQGREHAAGQSSTVSGYTSGGEAGLPVGTTSITNTIDKFPFASDANATDVGDLTQARRAMASQSSDASGYTSGGADDNYTMLDTIDKFPFSADSNATDVGDLSEAKWFPTGQQV
jgi:hypothetical protein